METAGPLARQKGLNVVAEPALGEVNFGDWQGKDYHELEHDPRWGRFNTFRSGTKAPGGESMLETQARMTGALFALASRHAGEMIAVFSHADAIKSAIACMLGIPLDFHLRLEILPASVTTVDVYEEMPVVRSVNVSSFSEDRE